MKTVKCKADLHNHLSYDADSIPDFNRTADIARENLGEYGILGITDSREEDKYGRFAKLPGYDRKDLGNVLYIPEKKLWIVRSQEVKSKNGHILAIGGYVGENVESGQDPWMTLGDIGKRGLVSVLAHPVGALGTFKFFEKASKRNNQYFNFLIQFTETVSAIETFNPNSCLRIPFVFPSNANRKAKKGLYELCARWNVDASILATSKKVGAVSFSDGRSEEDIGKCYTNITMPHPDEIDHGMYFNYCLNDSLRGSHFKDRLDENGGVVERLAIFDGKMTPGKWSAFKHCVRTIL